jgi:hypothetical protein
MAAESTRNYRMGALINAVAAALVALAGAVQYASDGSWWEALFLVAAVLAGSAAIAFYRSRSENRE